MAAPLTLPPELQGPAPKRSDPKPASFPSATRRTAVANPARLRKRHYWVGASFAICVGIPTLIVATYLYLIALPQYASTVGFSIRDEGGATSIDLLGGLSDLSGSVSKDADMLYSFLQSQQVVEKLDGQLDFAAVWGASQDPVFALRTAPTIEDKHTYWQRMVRLTYDTNAGLILVRTHAFRPDDATRVANLVLDQSRAIANTLADVSRDDLLAHANSEVAAAKAILDDARHRLSEFRQAHKIIDPRADIEGRLGLLNSLQAQKAQALIDYDLLLSSQTRTGDPRIELAERRIAVVEELIAKERSARGGPADAEYAELLANYEALTVDLEFAQTAYLASRANLEATKADAARTQKYLAVHIPPTRAERAEYPNKPLLILIVLVGTAIFWSIGLLVYYSIRDRR